MENKTDNKSIGTFLDNIHNEDYERPYLSLMLLECLKRTIV